MKVFKPDGSENTFCCSNSVEHYNIRKKIVTNSGAEPKRLTNAVPFLNKL